MKLDKKSIDAFYNEYNEAQEEKRVKEKEMASILAELGGNPKKKRKLELEGRLEELRCQLNL